MTQSTYLKTKKETIAIKNEVYKTISATDKAFAAIKETGDVTVWGDNDYGGKQPDLSGQTNFTHLFSNRGSFAGLKEDQTMFNWGNKNFGSLGGPSADITISPNLQELNQYTESYRKSNILSELIIGNVKSLTFVRSLKSIGVKTSLSRTFILSRIVLAILARPTPN